MKKYKIIYEPVGKAKEYAHLALNLYNGCTHACVYCYGRQYSTDKNFKYSLLKNNVIEKLKDDIIKIKNDFGNNIPEILMSFQGDVYQPDEIKIGITREVIEILIENKLPFTILTKGGTRAIRDFDLLEKYDKCRFGTTLILCRNNDIEYWEPGAPSYEDRIEACKTAHNLGISTWMSMEPVIDPVQALNIIDLHHDIVDAWKVGKINYYPEIENKVDWIKFREDVKMKFSSYNITNYYLKNSLTRL